MSTSDRAPGSNAGGVAGDRPLAHERMRSNLVAISVKNGDVP
jgi:hypothetical protein